MPDTILSNEDTQLNNTPCPGGIHGSTGETDAEAVDFHTGMSYAGGTMEHGAAGVLRKEKIREMSLKFKMERR